MNFVAGAERGLPLRTTEPYLRLGKYSSIGIISNRAWSASVFGGAKGA